MRLQSLWLYVIALRRAGSVAATGSISGSSSCSHGHIAAFLGTNQLPFSSRKSHRYEERKPRYSCCLHSVTAEQVLEAVSQAEALFAQAVEARKTATALSDRAEEEAEAAAANAKSVETINQDQPITFETIAKADAVTKLSMDATSWVGKAIDAANEADRLEALADEALLLSEQLLDQHLIDFPDSDIAVE